jgi:hypothetical protein
MAVKITDFTPAGTRSVADLGLAVGPGMKAGLEEVAEAEADGPPTAGACAVPQPVTAKTARAAPQKTVTPNNRRILL